MRTRPLTAEELAFLRRAYGRPATLRHWQLNLLLALVAGVVFGGAFFIGSLFEQKSWPKRFTGAGLVGGAIAAVVFVATSLRRRGLASPFAQIHAEMQQGVCCLREYTLTRVWPLVDEGNEDAPDFLASLTEPKKFIAIPAHLLEGSTQPRRTLEVYELPQSKVTVSATYVGEPLTLEVTVIRTDNVWRHEDLPTLCPFAFKRLPLTAQRVIRPPAGN